MYKSFKYRLKPTIEQEKQLNEWVGMSRWIWNWCLTTNKEEYQRSKKFIFRYDLKLQIPKLKEKHNWLKGIPSQALQNRVIDFDFALKRVWKQGNGFPRYKSKDIEYHNTLRIDQTAKHIKPTKSQVKIPKMGWVKWVKHRPLEGKLKNITIKRENNYWWCICLCDIGYIPHLKESSDEQVVGIDLGITNFATKSDGEVFDSPHFYKKQEKKLKRKQKQLCNKKKGSNNRHKIKRALNKLHCKIKYQRRDFTHKTSTQIANEYNFVAVEDLNVKGMSKNLRLSKSISDQGWAMFVSQLQYKSQMNGGDLVKIGRYQPSTKTCSCCGNVQPMPLHKRVYECSNCGVAIDRDVNAAINIKRWGINKLNRCGTHRIYACGDTTAGDESYDWSRYVSGKQEKFLTFGKEAATL